MVINSDDVGANGVINFRKIRVKPLKILILETLMEQRFFFELKRFREIRTVPSSSLFNQDKIVQLRNEIIC